MLHGWTTSFQNFLWEKSILLKTSKTKRTSFPLDQNKVVPPTTSLVPSQATAGKAEWRAMQLDWARQDLAPVALCGSLHRFWQSRIAKVPEDAKTSSYLTSLRCYWHKRSAAFHGWDPAAFPLVSSRKVMLHHAASSNPPDPTASVGTRCQPCGTGRQHTAQGCTDRPRAWKTTEPLY